MDLIEESAERARLWRNAISGLSELFRFENRICCSGIPPNKYVLKIDAIKQRLIRLHKNGR